MDHHKKAYERRFNETYDPIHRVESVLKNAATMRDLDFHYKMIDIFRSMRDRHAQYGIPGAPSCIAAVQATVFEIADYGKDEKFIVSLLDTREDQVALSPDVLKLGLGDELLSVDGIPIKQYLNDMKFSSSAATYSGSLRASLLALTMVQGQTNRLPSQDETKYQFKSISGKNYNVSLPWVAMYENECLENAKNHTVSVAMKNLAREGRHMILEKRSPEKDHLVGWRIHKPESKNLGVIQFDSWHFASNDVDFEPINRHVRHLLANQLKDTKAILFDVRSDSSDYIPLADTIPHFFGIDVKTPSMRTVVHDLNRALLSNTTRRFELLADAYLKSAPWRCFHANRQLLD